MQLFHFNNFFSPILILLLLPTHIFADGEESIYTLPEEMVSETAELPASDDKPTVKFGGFARIAFGYGAIPNRIPQINLSANAALSPRILAGGALRFQRHHKKWDPGIIFGVDFGNIFGLTGEENRKIRTSTTALTIGPSFIYSKMILSSKFGMGWATVSARDSEGNVLLNIDEQELSQRRFLLVSGFSVGFLPQTWLKLDFAIEYLFHLTTIAKQHQMMFSCGIAFGQFHQYSKKG